VVPGSCGGSGGGCFASRGLAVERGRARREARVEAPCLLVSIVSGRTNSTVVEKVFCVDLPIRLCQVTTRACTLHGSFSRASSRLPISIVSAMGGFIRRVRPEVVIELCRKSYRSGSLRANSSSGQGSSVRLIVHDERFSGECTPLMAGNATDPEQTASRFPRASSGSCDAEGWGVVPSLLRANCSICANGNACVPLYARRPRLQAQVAAHIPLYSKVKIGPKGRDTYATNVSSLYIFKRFRVVVGGAKGVSP